MCVFSLIVIINKSFRFSSYACTGEGSSTTLEGSEILFWLGHVFLVHLALYFGLVSQGLLMSVIYWERVYDFSSMCNLCEIAHGRISGCICNWTPSSLSFILTDSTFNLPMLFNSARSMFNVTKFMIFEIFRLSRLHNVDFECINITVELRSRCKRTISCEFVGYTQDMF